MPGHLERSAEQSGSSSHQFRNHHLDDFEYLAHSNSQDGFSMNKSIPVANLLDGFEIIDAPSSSREERLVDLSPPPVRKQNRVVVALLRQKVPGLQFDKRNGDYAIPRPVELPAGSLVRNMALDDWKMRDLAEFDRSERREALSTPMEELSCSPTKCAMVTSADAMEITQQDAIHLLSANPVDRLELWNDFERFSFIRNLKVDDQVLVDVDETMRRVPAKVSWIGENQREPSGGIWYHVDFDMNNSRQWPSQFTTHDRLNRQFDTDWNFDMSGSSSVASSNRPFYSPTQLHMPMKGGGVSALYDNRKPVQFNAENEYQRKAPAPRERNIPITRQSRPPEPDYHGYMARPHAPPPSTSSLPTHISSQPSRSKSVHSMPVAYQRQHTADRNEPIDSDQLGFRVGDACSWNNSGVEEKGVIRFIGYLKGHRTLYAGVEFKNKIGAGTGVFNREQLFHAKDGHAGFVELSTLESAGSSSSSSALSNVSTATRRRLSSSRSQQMPTAAGTSVSVSVNGRHHGKQASAESLSDVPPPPYTPPSPPRASSAAAAHQQPPPIPPKPMTHIEDFLIDSYDVGHQVIVSHLGAQRSGMVRWLGDEMDEQGDRLVRSAIVQLDEDVPPAWRRSKEAASFTGPPVIGGVLVPVQSLRHNRSSGSQASVASFSSSPPTSSGTMSRRNDEFGSIDSGVEKQRCGPAKDVQLLSGRQKGIQGYSNSCYLDATLYAMFVQTTVFDFLLEKPVRGSEKAALFQKILAHEIVFPLRKCHYVRADHVMKLRRLLAELMPHMTGLTNEEKDPEEILAFIFSDIFNADPFIKLIGPNHSKDSQFLVPIVVDDWQGGAATSQHLLERHMRSAQVTFARPPPVLIMQLPRYGQQKVFDKILPLETIDITSFVSGAVAPCARCGKCSEVYCPTCFLTRRVFYSDIVYCHGCFRQSHSLPEIQDHECRGLYPPAKPTKTPHSHKMVLSAVLCIETSHYVAYVRTSSNQWVFFDSMADREGLSDGFNVPVVKECGNMSDWLSLQGWNRLKDADETGQIKAMFGKAVLDPLVGRLLSDSYICFYEDASPSSSPSTSSNLINTFKNMMN